MTGHDKQQSEKLSEAKDSDMKESWILHVCKGSKRKGLSLTPPCMEQWVPLGVCLPSASTIGITVPGMLCTTATHVVTGYGRAWM